MKATRTPPAGLWKPNTLSALYYGTGVVEQHLLSSLPAKHSKAFIVTGSSLATKTPLIRELERLLGSCHAATFSDIKEHAPITQLDSATRLIEKYPSIDTIISVGGGSPIDSAKVVSYRQWENSGKFLHHLSIPTTLSAAECTPTAGYTKEDGIKTAVAHPQCSPNIIFYDSNFAKYTPQQLWLSTGIRALDHAVELQYHATSTEIPCKQLSLQAIAILFELLPKSRNNPKDENIMTKLFLAAFASLGFLGLNVQGPLGLSHTLGYALGSPYGIPHGITSCITLGSVVKLKAQSSPEDAAELARALPYIGKTRTGDNVHDAMVFGDSILELVAELGLRTSLSERGVAEDQIPLITQRALGGEKEGKRYDTVLRLVESMY